MAQLVRWTAAEDALLRRSYGVLSDADLMKKLPGRTWESIKTRAKRRRADNLKASTPAGFWTPERIDRLRVMWIDATWDELKAEFAPATEKAIRQCAWTVKLTGRLRSNGRPLGPRRKPPRNKGGTWKPLEEIPGVLVSSLGQAMSARTGLIYNVSDNGFEASTPTGRRWINVRRQASLLFPRPAKREEPAAHPIMAAAEAAVSRWLEPADRADVVQDIVVAVLTGSLRFEDIPRAARGFVSWHNAAAGRYKTVSLDAEVFDGSRQTFVDRLDSEVARF